MRRTTTNNSSRELQTPLRTEMMECLRRSGYLLESTIVHRLTQSGFFVEPNQSLQDERTGRSRELDIQAEFHSYNPERQCVCAKTTFVMEVINNTYPFVLLTRRPSTPNSSTEYYLRYGTTPKEDAPDHFLGKLNVFDIKGVGNWPMFSQYCAFTRKKEGAELMAYHPDDVHTSLLKLAEFTLDAVEKWSEFLGSGDKYWRLFFWQPVLVLRADLFVLDVAKSGHSTLKPVSSGKLEFNLHYRGKPETLSVDIVTEPYLVPLLLKYVQSDELCEERIHAIKIREDKTGNRTSG